MALWQLGTGRGGRRSSVRRVHRLLAPLGAVAAVIASFPISAHASTAPLPVTPTQPGPPLLWAPLPDAPQLDNVTPWQAQPILVSGASAYRSGEFLYQDFIDDDHGANGTQRDSNDNRGGTAERSTSGTYTYPSDPRYVNNVADLVEFRAKPLTDATDFRVTLNSMTDPSLVAFTIAIGSSATSQAFPHGANSQAPAQWFLTVHPDATGGGAYAELLPAGGGSATVLSGATVSTARRQIDVSVPHTVWDPGTQVVRFAIGVGLWDTTTPNGPTGRYLIPAQNSTQTQPGGLGWLSSSTASAFFNVGFRFNESGDWRETAQATALENGDLSGFHADADFAKLNSGVNDDMPDQPGGVPQSGTFDRIFASQYTFGQGNDYKGACATIARGTICPPRYRGQLQPYNVYVPKRPMPAGGWGVTLLMHAVDFQYNEFWTTLVSNRNQTELGDRGRGSIVITPEARGPDGWYYGVALADVFEAWRDLRAHYTTNIAYSVASGYSMGGGGAWIMGLEFPDLFAAIFPIAAGPGTLNAQLPSMRHVPIEWWMGGEDEFTHQNDTLTNSNTLDSMGYEYQLDQFHPAEHFGLMLNDEYTPAADWLGDRQVGPTPSHVSFTATDSEPEREVGIVPDHAYWLSNMEVRDPGSTHTNVGQVDAVTDGLGYTDATPPATTTTAGVLTGGWLGALAYTSQSKGATPVVPAPASNHLRLTLRNVQSVTIDAAQAGLDCNAHVDIDSDGPVSVSLAGCPHRNFPTVQPDQTTGWMDATSSYATPSGNGTGFQNPSGAYARVGDVAQDVDVPLNQQVFTAYSGNVPSGAVVTGVEVRLDWWDNGASWWPQLQVELSADGGTTWSAPRVTPSDGADQPYEISMYMGGVADTWGLAWPDQPVGQLQMRVTATCLDPSFCTSTVWNLDWATVQIHYRMG